MNMAKVYPEGGMPIGLTLEPGTYFRCTCGKSQKLPFCDGSHSGSEELPIAFKFSKRQKVYLCGCGRSGDQPFL
jgi:CDGSH-type Zn-finger protein